MTVEGMKVGDIGRVRERKRDRKRESERETRREGAGLQSESWRRTDPRRRCGQTLGIPFIAHNSLYTIRPLTSLQCWSRTSKARGFLFLDPDNLCGSPSLVFLPVESWSNDELKRGLSAPQMLLLKEDNLKSRTNKCFWTN